MFKQKLKSLRRLPNAVVDKKFEGLHERAFAKIDCLECANCCTTTGPLFTSTDIARIAKKLSMKQKHFVKEYLRIDEDDDYVLNVLPCPFLLTDNKCSIYEFRPKACREYPHTDMSNQEKIFDLTLKNSAICPAVYDILENL